MSGPSTFPTALAVTVAVIRISSISINLLRVFIVIYGIPSSSFALTGRRLSPSSESLLSSLACKTRLLLFSFLDHVELMDHEKSSSSFRSDTTPLCSERFCPLHHGFFLSYLNGVHCLLVLNMFALLDHRCLLLSIRLNFAGLVFAVCIFWNFPFRSFWILTGISSVHRSWDNTPLPP